MVEGDAAADSAGSVPPMANGSGTQHASDALNDDFRRLVHSSSCGASLSPIKASSDAWSPGSHSWRSNLPGDSPGTSRASRRHRSQPFFIGVAGRLAAGCKLCLDAFAIESLRRCSGCHHCRRRWYGIWQDDGVRPGQAAAQRSMRRDAVSRLVLQESYGEGA
jgi:hypothetical protein